MNDTTKQTFQSDRPVLSIIIPSRNRAKYAVLAIRSVLLYPSDNFELVIQDNSSNDELELAIRPQLRDPRVIYNHTREPLDVIENFTRGLELATGVYVTFFGDDDGANPEIVDAAVWANQNDVEVLITTRPSEYYWPDVTFPFLQARRAARLNVKPFTGKLVELDPRNELRRCVRAGGDLAAARMPVAYRGIARRECVDRVKQQTGTYFPGLSPDLAIAVALAGTVTRFWQIDYPLFVPGMSRGNVHARGRADYDEIRLDKKPHLPQESVKNWSSMVPAFFSGPTIWAETAVQALTATNQIALLREFNIAHLHAICLVYMPRLFPLIIRSYYRTLSLNHRGHILGTLQLTKSYFGVWGTRLSRIAGNVLRAVAPNFRNRGFCGIQDIECAVNALSVHLKSVNRKFGDCL